MKFTDKKLKNLKPKTKRYTIYEDNTYGYGTFGVRVSPAGRKTWILFYRFQGQRRMLTLGTYPQMTVAQAHKASADAAIKLEEGLSPTDSAPPRHSKKKSSLTIDDLVGIYIENYAKKMKKSWKQDERILTTEVVNIWTNRPVKTISRRDIIGLLDAIADRGAPVMANRTLAALRKMFNYAISKEIVETSPCVKIDRPGGAEQSRDRVLNDQEIACLLKRLPKCRLSTQSVLAIRFLLVTAQRCSEVLSLEWSEIDFSTHRWTIPSDKTKNKLSHRVPLSQSALDILDIAKHQFDGQRFVFPSTRGDKQMTRTVLGLGVRRSMHLLNMEHWTPHDLRRTAASNMASLGIPRLTISKILNHSEKGVTSVYDRYAYDQEKREALEIWCQKLRQIEKVPEKDSCADDKELEMESKSKTV